MSKNIKRKLRKKIQTIIKFIVNFWKEDARCLNLALMGSWKNIDRKPQRFNDIDFVYLFKKVDNELMLKFKTLLEEIIKKFSEKGIEVKYSLSQGAAYKNFSTPYGILLHNLIFDVDLYRNYPSSLGIFSCQHDTRFLIKKADPKKIRNVERFTPKEIVNDPFGLKNQCLKAVRDKLNFTMEWKKVNKKWKDLPTLTPIINDSEFLDALTHSVIISFNFFSMLIYKNNFDIKRWYGDPSAYPKIAEAFTLKEVKFIKDIIKTKESLKNTPHLPLNKKEINEYRKRATKLIENIILKVNNL